MNCHFHVTEKSAKSLILALVKIAKERSESRNQSGVKRSLYQRIRMERGRKALNTSVQINLTNEGKNSLLTRERPFEATFMNSSFERKSIHTNDIKRLEDKIRKLDMEIRETEKMRNEVHRSNSISTHETEQDEENCYMQTPIQGRKSMPAGGVRNTIGQIRGILTHMVNLVNRDPNVDLDLSSELSSLVKLKAELKGDKETPEVIKSLNTFMDKTPAILESVNSLSSPGHNYSK